MREYHSSITAMEKQFAGFALRDTQCFCEDDRTAVEATVTEWFDPESRDPKKAISNFDAFVRDDLLRIMRQFTSSGQLLPYWVCLAVTFPVMIANSMMQLGNHQLKLDNYVT